MDKKLVHMVAFTLAMVGALNWGLVGLLQFNLVNAFLSSWPMVEQVVYTLIGASAIYVFATHMKDCKTCSKK